MNLHVNDTLGHIQPQMLLMFRSPLNRGKDFILEVLASERKQVNKQALVLRDTHVLDKLPNQHRWERSSGGCTMHILPKYAEYGLCNTSIPYLHIFGIFSEYFWNIFGILDMTFAYFQHILHILNFSNPNMDSVILVFHNCIV